MRNDFCSEIYRTATILTVAHGTILSVQVGGAIGGTIGSMPHHVFPGADERLRRARVVRAVGSGTTLARGEAPKAVHASVNVPFARDLGFSRSVLCTVQAILDTRKNTALHSRGSATTQVLRRHRACSGLHIAKENTRTRLQYTTTRNTRHPDPTTTSFPLIKHETSCYTC